jgi:hypothetical protein
MVTAISTALTSSVPNYRESASRLLLFVPLYAFAHTHTGFHSTTHAYASRPEDCLAVYLLYQGL